MKNWTGPLCICLVASTAYADDTADNPDNNTEQLQEIDERLLALEDDVELILGWQDKLTAHLQKMRLYWAGSYRATANNIHLVDNTVDTRVSHLQLVLDEHGQPQTDPATGGPQTRRVSKTSKRNIDEWYDSSWVNRLRLTISYDVTDNLRFYGQLAAYKYFNEITSRVVDLDMVSSRYPRDNTIRVERAYFDWFATNWLVFSVGRVAAPEGPPAELKENTTRSATWGVQMVEAELETAMVTVHLTTGTYLRVFYMPFSTHADYSLFDDTTLIVDNGVKPMHAMGGMLEWQLPFIDNNLGQLGVVYVPYFRPRDMAIDVPGYDQPVPPDLPTNNNLGRYANCSALLEFKDAFGSGLDLFAAYALTSLTPADGRMVYTVPVKLDIKDPDSGETVGQYESESQYEIGLASYDNDDSDTHWGHMFFAGFRYTPHYWLGEYAPRLGAELNRGTRYHIAWASPSDLLLNKLATKGWAGEVYWIQPLVPQHLFIRLGYLHLIREYAGTYVGPTPAVKQDIGNLYGLIEAHW